ncbi:MAG: PQQ-binding-like beta-propeller repeat protein [Acidobacteria bacterium]|nr:PQQ-binding-like beta-propeller repeat protein [Acidobacteriota bacterium]
MMNSVYPWIPLRAAELPRPGAADWTRFGYDLHNTRFNSKEKIIGPANVERLKVKWQFETVDGWPMQNTAAVIGDTLFFGAGGNYYALDSSSGKLKWKYEAGFAGEWVSVSMLRSVRSSCQYDNGRIYFGDGSSNVHCVDAATGQGIWKTALENNKLMDASMIYSPVVYRGKVIVGNTSGMAKIACLDAETGAIRWQFRVAQDVPEEWQTGGGSLWTSGAIDEQQNVVFNVTGSLKSGFAANSVLYTESILAHDLDTGELLWSYQAHPQDAFDLDFCAHPMIFDAISPPRFRGDVRRCVGAGNKAGFYCFNRHTGELYWRTSLEAASAGSGPRQSSTAVAYNRVFVQTDTPTSRPALSLTAALNAYNGNIEWLVPNPGMHTSAIAVANEVLYQGFLDGKLEALDAKTGLRLWEHALPSAFHGGMSIANGALFANHGIAGLNFDPEAASQKFAVMCFTIDGK